MRAIDARARVLGVETPRLMRARNWALRAAVVALVAGCSQNSTTETPSQAPSGEPAPAKAVPGGGGEAGVIAGVVGFKGTPTTAEQAVAGW